MTGPVGVALQTEVTGAIAELLADTLGLEAQLANAIGSAITFFVVAVAGERRVTDRGRRRS